MVCLNDMSYYGPFHYFLHLMNSINPEDFQVRLQIFFFFGNSPLLASQQQNIDCGLYLFSVFVFSFIDLRTPLSC